ncbi:hypothetical protein ACS5PU_23635 [Pedobacter sp. GSP4]|uniref:hypothetical protein n=1 Tax=Pedobacter sp. GSP4 TaxID=3453716 RepID=UPI003EEC6A7B
MKKRLLFSTFIFLLFCIDVFGQSPRYLINAGFEVPGLNCTSASYSILAESEVPGWVTSDIATRNRVVCGTTSGTMQNGIEIWSNNYGSVPAHSGSQFAEVNAYIASGLYQNLCLLPNETVTFSIWHRKRENDDTRENLIVELIDPATGVTVGRASSSHDAVYGSWTLYSGTVTNNGVQGTRRLGIFGRRYASNGSTSGIDQSRGNLIDDADIDLKPLADIRRFTSQVVTEGSVTNSATSLELYISGNLKDAATVTLQKSGSATYNTDYTIGTPTKGSISVDANGNIVLTLPPGDYDSSNSTGANQGIISIPFTAVNDAVTESGGESITYTVTNTAGGGGGNSNLDMAYNIGGYSAGCSVRVGTATFNITDSPIVLSGELFNDADGLKDNAINGTGTNIANGMFITVLNGTTVVATKAIPACGHGAAGHRRFHAEPEQPRAQPAGGHAEHHCTRCKGRGVLCQQ